MVACVFMCAQLSCINIFSMCGSFCVFSRPCVFFHMYVVGVEFAFCVDIWPGSGGWWPKRVQTRRSQQSWSLPPSFPSWNCLSSLNFKLSRFFRKSFFWLFCFVSFLLLTPSSSRCPPLSAICNSGIILVFTPFCLSLVYHTVNASFPPHGLSSIHPRVLLPRFLPHYSVFISVQYCEPSNNFLALVCFLFSPSASLSLPLWPYSLGAELGSCSPRLSLWQECAVCT